MPVSQSQQALEKVARVTAGVRMSKKESAEAAARKGDEGETKAKKIKKG